jgi:hypothetical protein
MKYLQSQKYTVFITLYRALNKNPTAFHSHKIFPELESRDFFAALALASEKVGTR